MLPLFFPDLFSFLSLSLCDCVFSLESDSVSPVLVKLKVEIKYEHLRNAFWLMDFMYLC